MRRRCSGNCGSGSTAASPRRHHGAYAGELWGFRARGHRRRPTPAANRRRLARGIHRSRQDPLLDGSRLQRTRVRSGFTHGIQRPHRRCQLSRSCTWEPAVPGRFSASSSTSAAARHTSSARETSSSAWSTRSLTTVGSVYHCCNRGAENPSVMRLTGSRPVRRRRTTGPFEAEAPRHGGSSHVCIVTS